MSDSDLDRKESYLTWRLGLALTSCVVGASFQFGYHTGVVNAPQKVIEEFLNSTYYERNGRSMPESTITLLFSVIVSIYAIGGMIGGFTTGWYTNRFGRKGTMLLNNILIAIGGGLMVTSKFVKSYEVLIAGRLVIGFSCGISTAVAPVYLSEISPVALRGAAGTLNQFAIVSAVLLSEIFGLQRLLGNQWGWPYLLGLTFVPAVFQLITLPFCPESPRYLYITKDRTDKAREALVWLRGTGNVEDDLLEMEEERTKERATAKVGILDLFRVPSLREPLIISVVMQLSQQLSGINAVVFYSTSIFESAGLSASAAQYATIGTGAVNVAMTFVSAILVDRMGRRTLHLYGLGGMWVFSTMLITTLLWRVQWGFMSIFSIAAVILYIVSFATGPGSIPWFIVAELFSQGPRPAAMSIAVLVNWIANFLVGVGFPEIQKGLKDYSFLPFVVLLAIFWIFTYLKVPETKNKSIEEITALFKRGRINEHLGEYQPLPDQEPALT